MSKWYKARGDAQAELSILQEIGDAGISASEFSAQLKSLGEFSNLLVRINSPGGDVMQGMGIYNALTALDCEVICRIEGIAASAASLIAMAGDRIEIAENAFMLVHEPFAGVVGTADDLQTAADDVQKMTDAYVAIYVARTGMSADDVRILMREDRLMTATEATELGFADAVMASKPAVKIDAKALSMRTRAQLRGHSLDGKKGKFNMATNKTAKAEDDQDGVTLSSLHAALEQLTEAVSKLAARAADDDQSTDSDEDQSDDDKMKDGESRAADDGDGDESKDGDTENRGASKAIKASKINKSYAISVMDMCALAGLGDLAAGFVARGEKIEVVRRKLLAERKNLESKSTRNHRSGVASTVDAVASSWDVAIAKAFPKNRN